MSKYNNLPEVRNYFAIIRRYEAGDLTVTDLDVQLARNEAIASYDEARAAETPE